MEIQTAWILNVDATICPRYDVAKDMADLDGERCVTIAPNGCQELQLPLAAGVAHGEFLEYYQTKKGDKMTAKFGLTTISANEAHLIYQLMELVEQENPEEYSQGYTRSALGLIQAGLAFNITLEYDLLYVIQMAIVEACDRIWAAKQGKPSFQEYLDIILPENLGRQEINIIEPWHFPGPIQTTPPTYLTTVTFQECLQINNLMGPDDSIHPEVTLLNNVPISDLTYSQITMGLLRAGIALGIPRNQNVFDVVDEAINQAMTTVENDQKTANELALPHCIFRRLLIVPEHQLGRDQINFYQAWDLTGKEYYQWGQPWYEETC